MSTPIITPPIITNSAALDAMRSGPTSEEGSAPPVVEEFVSATAPDGLFTDFMDGSIALTPGAILALLRRRLNDVDRQIDGYMTEIEANTNRSNLIQQKVEAMQLIKASMANIESDPASDVELSEITVTWNGESMNAADLMNELGIDGVELGGRRMTPDFAREKLREAEERLAFAESFVPEDLLGTGREADAWAVPLREKVAEWERHLADVEGTSGSYSGSQTITGSGLDSFIQQLSSQARRTNSSNEMLMVQMQSAMQQRGQAVTLATQTLKALNDQMNSIAQNVGR